MTVTVLPLLLPVMVQVNVAEPLAPVPSVAVTVTVELPAVVGVPEIRPLLLIDSPAGRPLASRSASGRRPSHWPGSAGR